MLDLNTIKKKSLHLNVIQFVQERMKKAIRGQMNACIILVLMEKKADPLISSPSHSILLCTCTLQTSLVTDKG